MAHVNLKMSDLGPGTRATLLELHRTLAVEHPEFLGVQITYGGHLTMNPDSPPIVSALVP